MRTPSEWSSPAQNVNSSWWCNPSVTPPLSVVADKPERLDRGDEVAAANAKRSVSITLPNYPNPRSDSRRSEGISGMAFRTQVMRIVFRISSATTTMLSCLLAERGFPSSDTTLWPPQNMHGRLGTRGRSRFPFRYLGFGGSRCRPMRGGTVTGREAKPLVVGTMTDWFGPGGSDAAFAAGSA
jgi:hypothetical protein